MKTTVALAYDFDETLAVHNMLRHIEEAVGVKSEGFEKKLWDLLENSRGDLLLLCLYLLVEAGKEAEKPFTAEAWRRVGAHMVPFPGLPEWFDRINAYGAEQGLSIEHYVISSNIREILEGTPIARYFTRIYGSSYLYDASGYACWPSLCVDYTNKTQFLFRISKGCLDESDMDGVNAKVEATDKRIPFEQIIFVGDGETDVPCMKLVRQRGGHSFAVYNPGKEGAREFATGLKRDGRVCAAFPADYRENSPMDQATKAVLDGIAANLRFKQVMADAKGTRLRTP